MNKPLLLLTSALLLAALPAQARVYECGDGRYSSKPAPGCRSADLPRIGSYSAPPKAVARAPVVRPAAASNTAYRPQTAAAAATPVAAPAASPRSNNGRRMILEQELANERRALNEAQRTLTESRVLPRGNPADYAAHQARINSLQSDVLDRQQNVQALQRELSRM